MSGWRDKLLMVAVYGAAAIFLIWYPSVQRPEGDVTVARSAIQDAGIGLQFLRTDASSATVQSYIVNAEGVDVFLASESGRRLPKTAAVLARTNLACDAAFELWVYANRGVARPPLSAVPDVRALVEAVPELRGIVATEAAAGATVENTRNTAVAKIVDYARGQVQLAESTLEAEVAAR
jgi:hypothetical protein